VAVFCKRLTSGGESGSGLPIFAPNILAKKTYRGVTRSRPLTRSEAAKYRKLREQIAAEIPPVEPLLEKIAVAKLRAMRKAKGVRLSELAARTGITRGNLARLESQKNATLRSLRRYANGLDCELEIHFVSVKVAKKRQPGAVEY